MFFWIIGAPLFHNETPNGRMMLNVFRWNFNFEYVKELLLELCIHALSLGTLARC
jgi:hypothetical protein